MGNQISQAWRINARRRLRTATDQCFHPHYWQRTPQQLKSRRLKHKLFFQSKFSGTVCFQFKLNAWIKSIAPPRNTSRGQHLKIQQIILIRQWRNQPHTHWAQYEHDLRRVSPTCQRNTARHHTKLLHGRSWKITQWTTLNWKKPTQLPPQSGRRATK